MSNSRGKDAVKAPLLNIASVLTAIGLALVPVFVVVYLNDTPVRSACAWTVFATAAFMGKTDGHLTRNRNSVTGFGKITDSVADRTLISSALIPLSWYGRLYWWIAVIMIGRELFITAMHMTIVKKKVMAAGRRGKIKMFFQSMGIAGLFVPWASSLPGALAEGLLWTSYAVIGMALYYSVAFAVEYIAEAREIARGE